MPSRSATIRICRVVAPAGVRTARRFAPRQASLARPLTVSFGGHLDSSTLNDVENITLLPLTNDNITLLEGIPLKRKRHVIQITGGENLSQSLSSDLNHLKEVHVHLHALELEVRDDSTEGGTVDGPELGALGGLDGGLAGSVVHEGEFAEGGALDEGDCFCFGCCGLYWGLFV